MQFLIDVGAGDAIRERSTSTKRGYDDWQAHPFVYLKHRCQGSDLSFVDQPSHGSIGDTANTGERCGADRQHRMRELSTELAASAALSDSVKLRLLEG